MEGVKLFSIDSLLSRPDPVPSEIPQFYESYQPRGTQVIQHVSAKLLDFPETSSKRYPYVQMKTELNLFDPGKAGNVSSTEDKLGLNEATKRSADETLLTSDSQHGSPYYKKYRKLKGSCGYAPIDGELNNEQESIICPMGVRKDPKTSYVEPIQELYDELPSWTNSTESFAEDFEETFESDRKPEVKMTIDGVSVSLENSDLWTDFYHRGTEMIINRAGRRMFPRISVRLTGLKPHVIYRVQLSFERSDRRRYKFVNGKWHTTQIVDSQDTSNIYSHPDSPNTGSFWMKDAVCFSKLKITNNPRPEGFNVFLQSMHKYIPHIIIQENDTSNVETSSNDSSMKPVPHSRNCYNFCFPVTSFVAVTAYQNEKITHLKIKNNPFAKAFRESDKTSLQQIYFGSGSIPQNIEKEGFPVYHSLRNAESLGCMPTSDKPFLGYKWSNTRPYMTKSLHHFSTMASSDARSMGPLNHVTRRSRRYASNFNLASESSSYLGSHQFNMASMHSRFSSSNSSVLWENDSAYGSLNSVLDHHV